MTATHEQRQTQHTFITHAWQAKRIQHRLGESIVNDEINSCEQCKRSSQAMPSDKNAIDAGFRAYFIDGFEQIVCDAVVVVEETLVNTAVVALLKRRVHTGKLEICDPVCERLAAAKRDNDAVHNFVNAHKALDVLPRFVRPERLKV